MARLSLCTLCLPALVLLGCASSERRPPAQTGPVAVTPGGALRSVPDAGTRYLTAMDSPTPGAVVLPDWVVNPTLDGVLGAVGVAALNDLGTSHQIDNARATARLEIARMLEVRVQDVGRRDIEQQLRTTGQGQVTDQGSRKSLLGVDRNIADSVLSGSRQRALWFDPGSGDCYVWMVMDGAVQTKADHYVENGVSVYVANTPITKEYRPERPKPEQPAPVVTAPAPAPPEPIKSPIEQLETNLKKLEAVPIKAKEGGK